MHTPLFSLGSFITAIAIQDSEVIMIDELRINVDAHFHNPQTPYPTCGACGIHACNGAGVAY